MAECALCRESGWVHVKLRADERQAFAFICGCPAASRIKPGKAGSKDKSAYWVPELEDKYITFAAIERGMRGKKVDAQRA